MRQIEFVCLFMFNAILIEMVITSTHYNRFTAISADDIIHNYKAGSFLKGGGGVDGRGECVKGKGGRGGGGRGKCPAPRIMVYPCPGVMGLVFQLTFKPSLQTLGTHSNFRPSPQTLGAHSNF